MNYVISDIHGQFERYMDVVNFIKNDDKLFILGDVIDRGPDGIKILKDIMKRPNIELLIGNHELMMLNTFEDFFDKGSYNEYELIIWTRGCNGGYSTLMSLESESKETIKEIYDFLIDRYLIRRLEVNGNKFHLSHSFTVDSIKGDLKFIDASKEERFSVVWNSIFPRRSSRVPSKFKNKEEICILGHTPVQKITDSNEIYKDTMNGVKVYNIDCGMAYGEDFSRLACLRLEDFEEFYF